MWSHVGSLSTRFSADGHWRCRGFSRLLDKMAAGDIVIVTELDRLGRDAIKVCRRQAKPSYIGAAISIGFPDCLIASERL